MAPIIVNPSSLKRLVVNQSFVPERTKLTKKELNENAIKFKTNIESELSKEKCEIADPVGTMSRKANKTVGARYECIYKNFLREVRQFYSNKYEEFMKNKPTIRKNNLQMKSILFPYHMLLFASESFDHGLI